VEEHALVGDPGGVLLANFLLAVVVPLPQATVADLLHFDDVVAQEKAA
jgi:hypothetical protein